jgi:hypothetical protein
MTHFISSYISYIISYTYHLTVLNSSGILPKNGNTKHTLVYIMQLAQYFQRYFMTALSILIHGVGILAYNSVC